MAQGGEGSRVHLRRVHDAAPRWLRDVAERLRRFQHAEPHGRPRPGEGVRRSVPAKWIEGRVVLLTTELAPRARDQKLQPQQRRDLGAGPETARVEADDRRTRGPGEGGFDADSRTT